MMHILILPPPQEFSVLYTTHSKATMTTTSEQSLHSEAINLHKLWNYKQPKYAHKKKKKKNAKLTSLVLDEISSTAETLSSTEELKNTSVSPESKQTQIYYVWKT